MSSLATDLSSLCKIFLYNYDYCFLSIFSWLCLVVIYLCNHPLPVKMHLQSLLLGVEVVVKLKLLSAKRDQVIMNWRWVDRKILWYIDDVGIVSYLHFTYRFFRYINIVSVTSEVSVISGYFIVLFNVNLTNIILVKLIILFGNVISRYTSTRRRYQPSSIVKSVHVQRSMVV